MGEAVHVHYPTGTIRRDRERLERKLIFAIVITRDAYEVHTAAVNSNGCCNHAVLSRSPRDADVTLVGSNAVGWFFSLGSISPLSGEIPKTPSGYIGNCLCHYYR
jgi:hypothetical protein